MNADLPPHRQHAVGFIKHKGDADYVFTIPADSEIEGERFVQRIRVELSRMRKYVRDQGLVVKPFRMKLVSIEFVDACFGVAMQDTPAHCKITLRKDAPDAQIARDVADVFADLTGGETLK